MPFGRWNSKFLEQRQTPTVSPTPGRARQERKVSGAESQAAHLGAVDLEEACAALLRRSGDGKSSLAAALVERGHALVADDVAAVVLNGTQAIALPGFAALRLRKRALDKLRVVHRSRVRGTLEKFWVPAPRVCDEPLPVSAAFVLTPHNRPDIRIEPLPPGDAFRMLTVHAHRLRVMDAMGQRTFTLPPRLRATCR